MITRLWMVPVLMGMYWWPTFNEPETWDQGEFDIYTFTAPDRIGLAVVTPDPFASETGLREWRAEIHMRVGDLSIMEELPFRAETIEEDTVVFIETAWGREVHIFEADPNAAPGEYTRRRWLATPTGLKPVNGF